MRIAEIAAVVGILGALALADDAATYCGEVTAKQLRLRAGPGEAYQEVVRLEKGARVVVLGVHPNDPTWLQVEVPQGYEAWVFGEFLAKGEDGTGTVTGDRVLIRPRPSTRYHQLAGVLRKGDTVRVVGEEKAADGVWYRVVVPRSVPLYAHGDYLKNVGPASLAEPPPEAARPAPAPAPPQGTGDGAVLELEKRVRDEIAKGWEGASLEPLKRALAEVDRDALSAEMRDRRYRLQSELLEAEKEFAVKRMMARESTIRAELEKRLGEIESEYKRKLQEIRAEHERPRTPAYTAQGIVRYRPDIFGRHPDFRIEEGGRIRYFLVSTDYDLSKFQGKRVGVLGLIDPESGTGRYTVIVKRIEILGNE
jgi:uncharacterized protein YraI